MPNEIQLPPGDGTPQPARLVSYQPGPGPFHYVEMPDDGSFRETPGGLAEYWQILRRRKGALVLAAFAGALMALLVTLPQTPVYRGETSIEVLGINENFLNMRDVNPNSTGGAAYPPEYDIQTQVRILQSRPLLETVVRKTNLAQRMASVRPPRVLSAVRKALGSEQPPLSPAEQALNMAVRDLKIRTQPNTRVIEIWYDSTDPRLAAEFANTLANEFIEYNLRERWATSQHTSDWLTRQLEALKTKLEKSEAQLQSYARRSGLVITSETGNVTEERLRQIQDELSKAQADRIVRQSQYELATQASPDSLPQVLEDPGLREYHNKLTELRRQLAELTSTLTPAHPKVIKLEAQIKTLQSALERARANIIDRIRNEYAAARRREKLLAGDYERQTRHISAEAARLSRYSLLKREVDTTRQLYDSLLQRVKEASLASALRATNIRVI
ncbi:MAG: GumC family protein [Acidobacteria bacterium]|nr:GumC family protein [Acidobacteriota bacterium]